VGWKGLTRDTVMFVIGIGLLLNWIKASTAAIVIIITAAAFTAYAWFRFFKG
jgi:hypothetical protein